MKIIVICGGSSSEKEISVKSGMAVFSSIQKKYNAKILLLKDNYRIIKDEYNDNDIIFNALHGGYGENGEIQEFFEKEEMKFVGSGSKACRLAINKDRCKKVALKLGVESPYGKLFNNDISIFEDFNRPFIIKPNKEGSSVGFFIVNSRKEMLDALKYNNQVDVIFENFVKGRELTVSIINDRVLPIVEIIPESGIYDYESKYVEGKSSYIVPAEIDLDVANNLKEKSLEIFRAVGCKDYARIDYILSEENIPYFLEINTSPGMTKTSLFPKSARNLGIDFDRLIEEIIGFKK